MKLTLTLKLSKLEDFIFDDDDRVVLFFSVYESLYHGTYVDDVEYMADHSKRLLSTLEYLKPGFSWDDNKKTWSIKK